MVLDDRSASVWVLGPSDQQQVGGHAFTLSRGEGQTLNTNIWHISPRGKRRPRGQEVDPADLW